MESFHHLLPFVSVNINEKSEEGDELRRIMSIDRSEAIMLMNRLEINTVLELIEYGTARSVSEEYLLPCFFKSQHKTTKFLNFYKGLVREFKETSTIFIEIFLALRECILDDNNLEYRDLPEVMLIGGEYSKDKGMNKGQIEVMLKLISKVPHVKALSLVFTRFRNSGLKHL